MLRAVSPSGVLFASWDVRSVLEMKRLIDDCLRNEMRGCFIMGDVRAAQLGVLPRALSRNSARLARGINTLKTLQSHCCHHVLATFAATKAIVAFSCYA